MKRLALVFFALVVANVRAEWQIEYDASFVEVMRRAGHPIAARVGHYATRTECEAAIDRAVAESGDPSLRGKMRAVGYDDATGSGGPTTVSQPPPPRTPARNLRKEEAEYQEMVARHEQIVAEVERELAAKQAAFLAERDGLAASLQGNTKSVLDFKDSPKPPPSALPALKQLEAATMLSALADRAELVSNGALARELSEIAANLRQTFDETLRRKAPDVPVPTPVQQQFYGYVTRESKAVAMAIQKIDERRTAAFVKQEQAAQQVAELTGKVEQLQRPPPEQPKPADADKLLAEAQALLAQAQSEKQALATEIGSLEAASEAEYKKLGALDKAVDEAARQPERAEALLKQLQGAPP